MGFVGLRGEGGGERGDLVGGVGVGVFGRKKGVGGWGWGYWLVMRMFLVGVDWFGCWDWAFGPLGGLVGWLVEGGD